MMVCGLVTSFQSLWSSMECSIHALAYAEGTLGTQLALTCLWGVIWYLLIENASKKIVQPWVASKKWKDQWNQLHRTTWKNTWNVDLDEVEGFEFNCTFLVILMQHLFGGLLCVPSMLGFQGPVVWALASHGALCEAGWELQDLVKRIYEKTLGTEAEKKRNPASLLQLFVFHHIMGLSMVIPMNILYGDNTYYHEFVFLLQGAAFVAMMSQNYGFTLDVRTRTGLAQMRACVSITLATLLWSRWIRYGFIGYKLISMFHADGRKAMLFGGVVALLFMGIINTLFVVDAFGKFSKFMFKMDAADDEVKQAVAEARAPPRRQNSNLCASPKADARWHPVWSKLYKGMIQEAKKQQ